MKHTHTCQRRKRTSSRASKKSTYSLGTRMVSKGINYGILILNNVVLKESTINRIIPQTPKKPQNVELDVDFK